MTTLADDDITVTGYVPDADAELDQADLVIVPLRAGLGTRLKILEAFSHQVPVVSIVIGAAGIAAVDGRGRLLADDPAAFAEACVRLLRDDDLRRRVTGSRYALAAARYDWRIIERQIGELAIAVARDPRGS